MNYPGEAQIGHDLRELASGPSFTVDLATIRRLARQRHRRRLIRRGTSAAGAVVLATGGLFLVHGFTGGHGADAASAGRTASAAVGQRGVGSTAGHSAGPAGQGATGTAIAHAETVAYVTAQIKAALGNVNNYVLREDQVQTGPSGNTSTIWTDPRTSNAYEILNDPSAGGKSLAWLRTYLVKKVLTWKDIEADYSTRTWFDDVFHAAGPIQGSTAGATSTVMTPAEIKSWLDAGQLKIVGHQDINGHQAIGLRGRWIHGYRELWVDSKTFLPVRIIEADFANQKGPLQNVMLIDNDSWLPRSKSLLALVNDVRIPAGFTQIPPPQ